MTISSTIKRELQLYTEYIRIKLRLIRFKHYIGENAIDVSSTDCFR